MLCFWKLTDKCFCRKICSINKKISLGMGTFRIPGIEGTNCLFGCDNWGTKCCLQDKGVVSSEL